jgi:hypothetical protein
MTKPFVKGDIVIVRNVYKGKFDTYTSEEKCHVILNFTVSPIEFDIKDLRLFQHNSEVEKP